MDDRLIDLARARGGLITAAEAARVEVTPARLARLRALGTLVHIRRGVSVLAPAWEDATEEERYALRVRAVLRTRDGVAASHHAALSLAGVRLGEVPLDRIDLVDTTGRVRRVRTRNGLVLHPITAHLPADGAVDTHRVGARSQVQVDVLGEQRISTAAALLAVARDISPTAFAVVLDQALSAGVTSIARVRRELHLVPPRSPWVPRVARLLEHADPLSPSPQASRLRLLLRDMGFQPRVRVPIRTADGLGVLRPELLIGTSIAIARTAYAPHDRARLRQVGVTVALVPDSDLDHPDRVASAIAEAMRELDLIRREAVRGA